MVLTGVPLTNLTMTTPYKLSLISNVALFVPKLELDFQYNFEKLTRNPESLQQIYTDPMYYKGPLKIWPISEYSNTILDIHNNLNWIDWPILYLGGSEDIFVDSDGAPNFLIGIASQEKSYKIYNGFYHQLFDDPDNSQVLGDLVQWLNEQINSKWDFSKMDKVPEGTCEPKPTIVMEYNT